MKFLNFIWEKTRQIRQEFIIENLRQEIDLVEDLEKEMAS